MGNSCSLVRVSSIDDSVLYRRPLEHLFLSSPAEPADAQRAEEGEGKGTQVGTQEDSRKTSRANSQRGNKASPPGSPSLARAKDGLPKREKRAARARRG